jgi:hypothetical protein
MAGQTPLKRTGVMSTQQWRNQNYRDPALLILLGDQVLMPADGWAWSMARLSCRRRLRSLASLLRQVTGAYLVASLLDSGLGVSNLLNQRLDSATNRSRVTPFHSIPLHGQGFPQRIPQPPLDPLAGLGVGPACGVPLATGPSGVDVVLHQ